MRALRGEGFDVCAVAEGDAGIPDRAVIASAAREPRILITEDKEFDWLVYSSGAASAGVMLIRFPTSARAQLVAAVLLLVHEHPDRLVGAFAVVQPGQIRIERLPALE